MNNEKMTLELANHIIKMAKLFAVSIDTKMNIAIVDDGCNLVAFERMDGAWLGSIDIAIKKARTAKLFDMNTRTLETQPGQSLYAIEHTNGGLVSFPGGVLIKNKDRIIGAIGVSGSSVKNDEDVAIAGARAMNFLVIGNALHELNNVAL
jgi:uncharacterized protein GlcG (DUF336 family)